MPIATSLQNAVQEGFTFCANAPGVDFTIYRDDIAGTIIFARGNEPRDIADVARCVKARHLLSISYTIENDERSFAIYEPRAGWAVAFNPVDAANIAEEFA